MNLSIPTKLYVEAYSQLDRLQPNNVLLKHKKRSAQKLTFFNQFIRPKVGFSYLEFNIKGYKIRVSYAIDLLLSLCLKAGVRKDGTLGEECILISKNGSIRPILEQDELYELAKRKENVRQFPIIANNSLQPGHRYESISDTNIFLGRYYSFSKCEYASSIDLGSIINPDVIVFSFPCRKLFWLNSDGNIYSTYSHSFRRDLGFIINPDVIFNKEIDYLGKSYLESDKNFYKLGVSANILTHGVDRPNLTRAMKLFEKKGKSCGLINKKGDIEWLNPKES